MRPSLSQNGFDFLPNRKVVPVLLPIPADRPYSYAVPEGMDVAPGDYVQVPLGPRLVAAVVWDGAQDDTVDAAKLRLIEAKFDCPPLPADMRRFIEWLADYTLSFPGMVLRGVLRVPDSTRTGSADGRIASDWSGATAHDTGTGESLRCVG